MEDAVSYERLYDFKGTEKDLESHIIENIDRISESCGWGRIGRIERQFVIPLKKGKVIADIMLWHADGTGTVIEVKNTASNRGSILSSIGQILFYGSIMEKVLSKMPRLVVATPELDMELGETIVSGLCVVALSRKLKLTTTLDRAITQNPCYVPFLFRL